MSGATTFAYRAVRRDGSVETGMVAATTRDAAAAAIGRLGFFPIELTAKPYSSRRPARPEDLAIGLRALATLLGGGVALARALAILEDLAPPAWLPALPGIRRRVEHGDGLAAALETSTLALPPHVIGLLEAGEAGSGLARAVESGAELLEARAATRAALRNALAYPAMLAVAGSLTVVLLVGVVLPRFAQLLVETGQALPLSTRLVLGLGTVGRLAFVPGLLTIGLGALLWQRWLSLPGNRVRWHRRLFAVPAVGSIRRAQASASACAVLASLLDAGVTVAAALPLGGRAAGDAALEESLAAARRRIAAGEGIASALQAEDALTPTANRLVRIGEETGRLADMLRHSARIDSSQALDRLHRLIRVLEPALILCFGGLVMVVAAALLQAMYGLRVAP